METTTATPDAPKAKQYWIFQLISRHPFGVLVAFVGSLASIVGLLLIFFPWWTSPKRSLSYCVYPIRTPIVQTTNTSDVSVSYKGQPVSGNVTAAQIAIWNAGREPIRAADILSPLVLKVANGLQLFEVSFVKKSRDVIEPLLQQHTAIDMLSGKTLGPSSVELKFKILEHNDGVLIQIVYAGTPDAPITPEGTVVGQPRGAHKTSAGADVNTYKLLPVFGITNSILLLLVFLRDKQFYAYPKLRRILFCFLVLCLFFCLGVFIKVLLPSVTTPFGF